MQPLQAVKLNESRSAAWPKPSASLPRNTDQPPLALGTNPLRSRLRVQLRTIQEGGQATRSATFDRSAVQQICTYLVPTLSFGRRKGGARLTMLRPGWRVLHTRRTARRTFRPRAVEMAGGAILLLPMYRAMRLVQRVESRALPDEV